jgi:hypothetical protein
MSDTFFALSSGSAAQSVEAATSLTASTSPNPSTYGQTVTLSATVTAVNPAAGTPTGTVTFKEGTTVLGSSAVNASGQASASISTLAVGSHPITAEFAGSNGWQASNASAGTQSVQGSTSTSLGSSVNPSTYGQSVTFTATVGATTAGAGTPTGSVVFTIDGVPGSAVAVDATGHAAYSTSSLAFGSHTVSAAFTGTGGWQNSASSSLTQTVQGTTSTSVASSHNPSVTGQSVTFTTTVTSGAGTPVGSVTFKDGATTLTTVAVNGSGQASYTTSSLSIGSHTINGAFTGTGGWQNSSGSVVQSVTADTTPPTVPQNVTAIAGPVRGQITLSWNASSDPDDAVHHYEIWRSSKSNRSFALVTTVTGTTFLDNPGKNQTRYYYVIAVDSHGNKSAASATAGATALRTRTSGDGRSDDDEEEHLVWRGSYAVRKNTA